MEKAIVVREREDYVYSTDVVWQIDRARDWGICLWTGHHCPIHHGNWTPKCLSVQELNYRIDYGIDYMGAPSGYQAEWIRDGFTPFTGCMPGWIDPDVVEHISFYLERAGIVWGN